MSAPETGVRDYRRCCVDGCAGVTHAGICHWHEGFLPTALGATLVSARRAAFVAAERGHADWPQRLAEYDGALASAAGHHARQAVPA